MIPNYVPLDDRARYNRLYEVVEDVFRELGSPVFAQTWFRWLVLAMIVIAAARFMWRWVKGLL